MPSPNKLTREVLRGTLLRRFLELYKDGLRGAQLWQILRRSRSFEGLSNNDVSLVYQRYLQAAQATDGFLRLPRQQKPTLNSIPINPYLDVPNRVTGRVSYFVRIRASFQGEESLHTRVVQITSPWTLSRGELSTMLGDYFRQIAYTESGKLGSKDNTPVEFTSIEYLGIARKW